MSRSASSSGSNAKRTGCILSQFSLQRTSRPSSPGAVWSLTRSTEISCSAWRKLSRMMERCSTPTGSGGRISWTSSSTITLIWRRLMISCLNILSIREMISRGFISSQIRHLLIFWLILRIRCWSKRIFQLVSRGLRCSTLTANKKSQDSVVKTKKE